MTEYKWATDHDDAKPISFRDLLACVAAPEQAHKFLIFSIISDVQTDMATGDTLVAVVTVEMLYGGMPEAALREQLTEALGFTWDSDDGEQPPLEKLRYLPCARHASFTMAHHLVKRVATRAKDMESEQVGDDLAKEVLSRILGMPNQNDIAGIMNWDFNETMTRIGKFDPAAEVRLRERWAEINKTIREDLSHDAFLAKVADPRHRGKYVVYLVGDRQPDGNHTPLALAALHAGCPNCLARHDGRMQALRDEGHDLILLVIDVVDDAKAARRLIDILHRAAGSVIPTPDTRH